MASEQTAEYPATVIVHMGGKSLPSCDEHALVLGAVADMLRTIAIQTQAAPGQWCINCVNEAKATSPTSGDGNE